MKNYLVDDAVRDTLLGLPVRDRNWVVVGATPQQILDVSYRQVSRDFPTFLYPQSREEYALARTERKSGTGYTGFIYYAASDMTLEADLLHCDLTVSALAQDADGTIIDPYDGQNDLRLRLPRYVSPAFSENPLRALCVARSATRYTYLGFCIAEKTQALIHVMVEASELAHLAPERAWKETESALATCNPQIFFQTLRGYQVFEMLFPEVDALYSVPVPAKWCPGIDTGLHTLMTAMMAATLSSNVDVRLATLCHDLGKGLTSKALWPRHHGHGPAGVKLVEQIYARPRVPSDIRDLARLMAEHHDLIHTPSILQPKILIELFDSTDTWRKPQRVQQIVLTSEADVHGCTGFEASDYPQGRLFLEAQEVAQSVSAKGVVATGSKGAEIREEPTRRRIAAVAQWKEQRCPQPQG